MNNPIVVFGSAIVIAVLLVIFFITPAKDQNKDSRNKDEIKNEVLNIKSDDYVSGNPDAKVILVEYADFECEACGAAYPMVKELKEEFKDDLKVVVRYFPLPGHPNAMPAAKAVEAAGRQNKYWEMHNKLFETQAEWSHGNDDAPAKFLEYAEELDLDMEKFKTDIENSEVEARIQRDVTEGKSIGIQGTPSFFLNGKELIQNPQTYEQFKGIIEQEIATNSQ